MRIKVGQLRKLIKEAITGENQLALIIVGDEEEDFLGLNLGLGGEKMAILYDPIEALSTLGEDPTAKDLKLSLKNSLLGMIEVGKPLDRCLGAWEVKKAAGKGYARFMYPIAGALSPKNLLVPDRSSVSDPAKKAWQGQVEKGRERHKLDNVKDPKTSTKEDDCKFHPEEYLNYAYEYSNEGEKYISSFSKVHEDFVSKLSSKGMSEDEIVAAFKSLAKDKFSSEMPLSF